jgi:hypothetical protein
MYCISCSTAAVLLDAYFVVVVALVVALVLSTLTVLDVAMFTALLHSSIF